MPDYIIDLILQVHILSYQCSALTDADGIQRVFNQCIQLQQKQNLDTYTAVVVLDEIGLAEDSPNMPLKVSKSGVWFKLIIRGPADPVSLGQVYDT